MQSLELARTTKTGANIVKNFPGKATKTTLIWNAA